LGAEEKPPALLPRPKKWLNCSCKFYKKCTTQFLSPICGGDLKKELETNQDKISEMDPVYDGSLNGS
jgi:hypothetical protein